jgi:hypothetical protein
VDNNYLDLGMNKSGFVHTLPSGRLKHLLCREQGFQRNKYTILSEHGQGFPILYLLAYY